MRVRRFEKIESLNSFLKREEQGEISVKRVTIVPHTPDVFYVFYDGKNIDEEALK